MISKATAARTVLAVGAAALLTWRLRRRREEEERQLLEALKRRHRRLFLAVSDASGTRFLERSLRSVLRKRHVTASNAKNRLQLARLLLEHVPSEDDDDDDDQRRRPRRHALARQAIDPAWLQSKLDTMVLAYAQQPLDYGPRSRYGANWKISCYLVVLEKWKPRIAPHAPMVEAMGDVMHECVRRFEAWSSKKATVMNCFLTRYTAKEDENQLQKHIDGANVDGSVILALPTHDPYEGGALKVWEKGHEFLYDDLGPGDCIFLSARVWHQALPISSGTRFALVLFLGLAAPDEEASSS